jgi:hypothetical protein
MVEEIEESAACEALSREFAGRDLLGRIGELFSRGERR